MDKAEKFIRLIVASGLLGKKSGKMEWKELFRKEIEAKLLLS